MKILTPALFGRFGNILFQIFSAYGLAKKHGFKLQLPQTTINPMIWPNHHHIFMGELDFASEGTQYQHRLEEKNHTTIEPELSKLNGNVRLHAYLQKYTYFKDYLPELRTMIKRILQINNFNLKIELGIHVRRGDYLTLADYHTNLSENYYANAFKPLKKTVFVPHTVVFTDDFKYVNDYFINFVRIYYECHWLTASSSKNILTDFTGLMISDNLIISNSSFSLMAAILNEHANQIICPDESIWFGEKNKHLDITGMIPEHFTRIKSI